MGGVAAGLEAHSSINSHLRTQDKFHGIWMPSNSVAGEDAMRRSLWAVLATGGLVIGLMAGCTPKPSEEQLQELTRACASADEAESALEQSRRELTGNERQLAQARQTLQERENYLQKVRDNLQKQASEQSGM